MFVTFVESVGWIVCLGKGMLRLRCFDEATGLDVEEGRKAPHQPCFGRRGLSLHPSLSLPPSLRPPPAPPSLSLSLTHTHTHNRTLLLFRVRRVLRGLGFASPCLRPERFALKPFPERF